MGVDIGTYRGRIGTFKFANGNDVVIIVCIINLSKGLKVTGSVLFIGLLLLISGIEPNPGPRENDAEQERRMIRVSGIPKGVDKEHLHLVFKNAKKHGGGKISNIRFNEEDRSAVIQFEHPATVQSVLQKRPIMISGTVVDVDIVTTDASFQSAVCTSPTVEVTGFQMDDSVKELMEYYFEDEDSSGGDSVVDIKITEDGKVLVTFESTEVAQRVVDKGSHTLRQKPLTVVPYNIDEFEEYTSYNDSSTVSMEISSAQKNETNTGRVSTKRLDVDVEDIHVDVNIPCDQATAMEQTESDVDSKSEALKRILEMTALTDKYPGKISIRDIISIDLEANTQQQYTYKGLPWILLRRIIGVQCKARDLSTAGVVTENNEPTESSEDEVNVFDLLQVEGASPDTDMLSPFDIFLVTIQCCDPMLKQLLFKKLYLCKIALPFVLYDRLSNCWEILVWPFRSLVVESKIVSQSLEPRTCENEMLDLPVKTVTFANFGRPLFSKSKLMNDLLSDEIQDTFYNMNCPLGMSQRCISKGIIEMILMPSIGNVRDRFEEAVVLFNMRGRVESDFQDGITGFISKLSDIFVLVVDKSSFDTHGETLTKTVSRFKSIIIIIANSLDKSDIIKLKQFRDNLPSKLLFKVISTHKGVTQMNPKEMAAKLKHVIARNFTVSVAKSLEDRLSELSHLPTDEKEPECINGKAIAARIFQSMRETGNEGLWKSSITPVHYIYSKSLGSHIKVMYRLKDIKETCNVEKKIKQLRQEQLKHISEPVKLFIQSIAECNVSPRCKQYLLRWLSIFLEREKRKQLPCLISQNQSQRQQFEDLKGKALPHDKELETQSDKIAMSQELIENATLGIEHLFREMGHIYEAFIVLDKSPDAFELPSVKSVVQGMASFLNEGHTFEIVDGDNFYLPSNWVRSILEQMSRNIDLKKVLTLSVLGVQSSGKSTLLNSLFGSQFPVKSGRCTRGIHLQVLPIISTDNLPFHYVTVIDSEGLRATEFNSRGHSHDNKLSTVIAGLGDVTLLNVMGENTNEIRDIVQVVVHAFLKLKLVNKHLDIVTMFFLVHQNIMDISARDNMRTGLHVLLETLDQAAKDAGEIEGIREITTFRQVIDFDMNANVWYLPNYWQGNPPMARVNSGYSERLCDQRYKLLEKALGNKGKPYKSLNDVAVHTQDLWKGVLTEDFVFCFRNSLEIKAYIQMEETLKDILIKFENIIEREHVINSQKILSECTHLCQVHIAADKLIKRMRDVLTEKMSNAIYKMKEYFGNADYKDIILQWEDFAINRIKSLGNELEDRIKAETIRLRDRTCVELTIKENTLKHEAELYERALQVAKTIKGECLHTEEIENKFEEMWENISHDVINYRALQGPLESLNDNFEKCLFDIFNTEKLILKSELQRRGLWHKPEGKYEEEFSFTSLFQDMKTLTGSFESTGIVLDDISCSSEMCGDERDINLLYIEKVVDKISEEIDKTIDSCFTDREEVAYREVRRVLLKTHKEIRTQTKTVGFIFKITGIVKLCVHVSCFAHARFEAYNAEYQKCKGIHAKLENYKYQVREQFIAYVKDRKAEEVAAKQIIVILENLLWDKITGRIRVTVKTALKQTLPQLKFHLILEVLEDMANADDFESFIEYIKTPRKFVKQWMKKRAEGYLFGTNMMNYSQLATVIVNEFYDDIKRSVDKSCDCDQFKAENPSTENWIETFIKEFSKCSITKSEFQNVTKFLGQIEDIRNFRNSLVENLNVSVENIKKKSISQAKRIIKFTGPDSPLKPLFKQAWGCPAQCAFCGEPCAKGFSHSGSNHYSLQHRISCCSGAREDYIHKAVLCSCNYNVQSLQTHHCDLFGFRCNPDNKKPCKIKWHNYKDYKDYIPDWDIEPNANMQDCSKFWMWFVAKYKYQLAIHYRYEISDIPDTWDDIVKEDALANLSRIYTT